MEVGIDSRTVVLLRSKIIVSFTILIGRLTIAAEILQVLRLILALQEASTEEAYKAFIPKIGWWLEEFSNRSNVIENSGSPFASGRVRSNIVDVSKQL
jgi:hypothetical protein